MFIQLALAAAIFLFVAAPANAQPDSAVNLPNFLLPKFTKSVIKFKGGDAKSAIVNYNIIDEELVFVQDDTYMVLNDPQVIDTVYINSRMLIPSKNGFYEIIRNDPFSLVIRHKGYLEAATSANAYGVRSHTASTVYRKQFYGPAGTVNLKIPDNLKVVDDSEYMISRDGSFEKFSSKRQFKKIFKEKEKELDKFFADNSINFQNLSDIIRLLNYCNELYR